MDIEHIRKNGWIIFECISGSRSYGLDLPTSDTDIKGVYILPKEILFGLNNIPQVNNESNDIVFYELGRFVELLSKNNPNILEMLAIPEELILHKNPIYDQLKPEMFLSKTARFTFAGYAMQQIKKARGLNKKILNPIDEERKSILHFCYLVEGNGSVPFIHWLEKYGRNQAHCGLVNIPHMKNLYHLYYDENSDFKGIMQKENANEVVLSSIPKDMKPVTQLYFNKEGYSTYCKDYKEYWAWVKKRNDVRYQNTLEHGKNYDAKNMMHTFRLLDMAAEILEQRKVIVRRPNREELLEIRSGKFSYEELIERAEEKLVRIEGLYEISELPEQPDMGQIEEVLVNMRKRVYGL
ncbi:MAG: nucleotidyltransferase domain-containing protein [Bacteroidia bacterium]